MRITFLTRSLEIGGAERQLVILTKGLRKLGHDISIVTFYPNGALEKELKDSNVRIDSIRKKGRWDILLFFFKLKNRLQKNNPQILHSYLTIPNILSIVLKLFLKKTKIVWGVRAAYVDFSNYDWLTKFSYKLECLFSKFVDLIIVNSISGKIYATKNGFPEEKVKVIQNGVNLRKFYPSIELRHEFRKELNIREDRILIGLVGRIDPIKDHPTFLRAAGIFSQSNKNVDYICIGDGPNERKEYLHQLSKELGLKDRVFWLEQWPNMCAVYNALDLLTLTSTGEGFPNVLIEAMACGKPCVATNVGDVKFIIDNLGVVVPPSNPQKLVEAWETLIKSKLLLSSSELRLHISKYFNLDILLKKTEEVLITLLSARS